MAGQVSLRLVTFHFWQTLLADTAEGGAAPHALRLSGVGEALRRAGFGYDPAALEAADLRALARTVPLLGELQPAVCWLGGLRLVALLVALLRRHRAPTVAVTGGRRCS